MEERRVLHVLVDDLPADELVAAKRFLEYLRFRSKDPLRTLLDEAPLDDEAVTEEDLVAIREGLAEKARGEVVSQEEGVNFTGFGSVTGESSSPIKMT